jgi:hypothetical protein
MKSTVRRAGSALAAAVLAVPLGVGIAVAEDPAPSPTPTAEESADGSDLPVEAPLAELPEATTEEGTTADAGTPAPEATAPGAAEAAPTAPPAADEPEPGQIINRVEIASKTYPTDLSWLPSGVYSAPVTDLQMDGFTADGTRVPDLTMEEWGYSISEGPWVLFPGADKAFTIPGLVTGENYIDISGVYDQFGDSNQLADGDPITIYVQSLDEWRTAAEADTTIPRSEAAQGTSTAFQADAGFFAAGESVVITLVPVDGGAPVTFATTAAAADGSLEHTLTVPADLAAGSYYVVAEGQVEHMLGIHRMTVVAGQPAPTEPAAPAPEKPAGSGSDVLAATGADATTGLAAAGVLALVGAGALIGTTRARKQRAVRR